MSKAFEMAIIEHLGPEALAHGTMSIYQAAEIMWNAAIEHAAEACSALGGGDIFGPDENGTEDAYSEAVSDCAEAIRKEKTE